MAWFKFRRLVDDHQIPATMLVGHTPPSMAQAVIFLVLLGVLVDPVLLVGCMLALLMGGVLGAPLVARTRVWIVQLTVAVALLLAAAAYTMTNLELFPGGGTASSLAARPDDRRDLRQFRLRDPAQFRRRQLCADAGHAEPDGDGPAAVLPDHGRRRGADRRRRPAPATSASAVSTCRLRSGWRVGGIPAVLVAAFIVKEMPLEMLRWLVTVVVLIAAAVMFRAAMIGRRDGKQGAQAAPTFV